MVNYPPWFGTYQGWPKMPLNYPLCSHHPPSPGLVWASFQTFFTQNHPFYFPLPAHCELPTVNCPLWTAHCELHTVNCALWTAHCELPTVNCPLWTAHCELPTVNCALWTAHCELRTVNCALWTAHCELPTYHSEVLQDAYTLASQIRLQFSSLSSNKLQHWLQDHQKHYTPSVQPIHNTPFSMIEILISVFTKSFGKFSSLNSSNSFFTKSDNSCLVVIG